MSQRLQGRLVETLLLQVDRGEGLMLRLHKLKRELNDPASDLAFIHNEKAFVSLTKSLSSVKKGLASYHPPPKIADDLALSAPKVTKHLTQPFLTLLDVKTFVVDSLPRTFRACSALSMDAARAAQVAALYLDLVSLLPSLLLLASRIEARRAVVVAVRACAGQQEMREAVGEEGGYAALCDFVTLGLARPLVTAFEMFK